MNKSWSRTVEKSCSTCGLFVGKGVGMRLGSASQQRRRDRVVVAGLMLALWSIIGALAASPQLHHWLHKDSKAPTHECLVTQLGKGELLAGYGGIVVIVPPPSCIHLPCCAESQHFPASDYRVSPSRAPP